MQDGIAQIMNMFICIDTTIMIISIIIMNSIIIIIIIRIIRGDILAIFYPFSQFFEIDVSLPSL